MTNLTQPHNSPRRLGWRWRTGSFLLLLTLLRPLAAVADTATVVQAANTLITTSVASGASPTVQTSGYTLAIAKQWTNLPGGTRNGPTIGGGAKALTTDLSATTQAGRPFRREPRHSRFAGRAERSRLHEHG